MLRDLARLRSPEQLQTLLERGKVLDHAELAQIHLGASDRVARALGPTAGY